MENLLFSLNTVVPFFLLILLGYLFRRWNILSEGMLSGANRFVYHGALPLTLFLSTSAIDWSRDFSPRFLLLLFLSQVIGFGVIWALTELLTPEKEVVGTLVQGAWRGNYALLGIPMTVAVMGEAAGATAALSVIALIPTYNVLTVAVLMLRGAEAKRPNPVDILRGVATNPLILGTLAGLLYSLLPVSLPEMVSTTFGYIGSCATPLALLAIGGLFNWEAATARIRPSLYAALIKCALLPLATALLSYLLGFRGAELFIFYIATATPVAVSSYPMAVQMKGDGPLAANILILTTLLSAFTLSGGIYLLRLLGWI